MRTIKFRALSMCKGERWVYGDLRHYNRNQHTEKWTIHVPETGLETDVDEVTIGQFTGLKDKNGREIYEGDIVRFCRWYRNKARFHLYKVEYDDCYFCMISIGKNVCDYSMSGMGDSDAYRFEVVGNIHDNPELLDEEEEK